MHFKPEADMPVHRVIQLYLLDKIRDLEEIAVHLADSDRTVAIESVHDLRVICRQILSAFDAFSLWVCIGHLKPLKREIQRINRFLGPVRDLDVLLEQPEFTSPFRERAEHDRRYALSTLITECTGRKLFDRIGRMRKPLTGPDSERLLGLVPVTDKGRVQMQTLGPVIPEILYRLAAEITAYRPILARSSTPHLPDDISVSFHDTDQSIHQLRITCKRFRYTLALLKPLFSQEADEALKSFKVLQDLLGAWHDIQLMIHKFEEWSDSASAPLESVKKRQAALLASFHEIWLTLDPAWFHRLIRLLVDSIYRI